MIVVSKKVAPLAVQRNLIRRRIREAIHKFSTVRPKVAVIALPLIVRKSFLEIKGAVDQAMKLL